MTTTTPVGSNATNDASTDGDTTNTAANTAGMPSPTEHQLTERQLQAIEDEIKSTQPLTSVRLPIDALVQQYRSSGSDTTASDADDNDNIRGCHDDNQNGFLQSAKFLAGKYTHLRRVRGDGNCYYRAFLYALSERMLRRLAWLRSSSSDHDDSQRDVPKKEEKEFSRLKDKVSNSMEWICRNGYEAMTIDMFHEELVDLFDFIDALAEEITLNKSNQDLNGNHDQVNVNDDNKNDSNKKNHKNPLEESLAKLHERLNEENSTSDYCTWFLRVLTASQLKSNPDRYLPFLLADSSDSASSSSAACLGYDGMVDLSAFCAREVEPMGKECGMVQVAALAECLGVRVVIEYVDGRVSSGGVVTNYVFGEMEEEGQCRGGGGDGGGISISLLYRPGHYDILYNIND